MKKRTKWIVVTLTAGLAINGFPKQEAHLVSAEKAVGMVEVEIPVFLNEMGQIREQEQVGDKLQYFSKAGEWKYINENTYYGDLERLRFFGWDGLTVEDPAVITILAANGARKEFVVGKDLEVQAVRDSERVCYTLQVNIDDVFYQNATQYDVELTSNGLRQNVGTFHLVTDAPELEISCEKQEVWTEESALVQLDLKHIHKDVEIDLYVKKPGKDKWQSIESENLTKLAEDSYQYTIKESTKGEWLFAAAYRLDNVKNTKYSQEKKLQLMIDQTLPDIEVTQSRTGWSKEDVVFTLSNKANNVSDITYYVKHNSENWKPVDGNVYTVSKEQTRGKYQFKAVSEVGEDSVLYAQAENKSWISKKFEVSIDKTAPARAKLSIVRSAKDKGTGDWYGVAPKISFDYKQDAGSKISLYYALYKDGKREFKKYKDKQIVCDASDGNYTLEYYTEDAAGNVRKASKNIYIDKTAPILKVSGVQEKNHYNSSATMDLEVEEAVYKYATVSIDVNRTIDGKRMSVPSQKFELDQVRSHKKMVFSEEGSYEVSVQVTDKAGNKSEKIVRTFVVDKTAPVIHASAGSEKFFSKNAKVDIEVIENNYKESDVTISAFRVLDGSKKKVAVSGLNKTGKTSRVTEVFQEDGAYEVIVSAKDKAGNKAKEQKLSFMIDKTKPEISFAGVREKQVAGESVTLKTTIKELNPVDKTTTVQVKKKDMDGVWSDIDNKQIVFEGASGDYQGVFNEEGVYEITVKAKDKAKNLADKKIIFTIDKSAPIVEGLEKYDGQYVSGFDWKKEETAKVRDLTVVEQHVYVNGEEKVGDFSLKEDGKYVLELRAKDQLGQVEEKKIEFMIDATAPEITATMQGGENIVPAEANTVVNEEGKVILSVADEQDCLESVLVNGENCKLEKNSQQCEVEIDTIGTYDIEACAVDQVGNKTVFSTKVKYEKKNTELLWLGALAAVIVLVVGGSVIAIIRRKKN